MADLKIEYVDIGELKTYANNAKIHTAEQIEQINSTKSRNRKKDLQKHLNKLIKEYRTAKLYYANTK